MEGYFRSVPLNCWLLLTAYFVTIAMRAYGASFLTQDQTILLTALVALLNPGGNKKDV
jgi:hypothetical protein